MPIGYPWGRGYEVPLPRPWHGISHGSVVANPPSTEGDFVLYIDQAQDALEWREAAVATLDFGQLARQVACILSIPCHTPHLDGLVPG